MTAWRRWKTSNRGSVQCPGKRSATESSATRRDPAGPADVCVGAGSGTRRALVSRRGPTRTAIVRWRKLTGLSAVGGSEGQDGAGKWHLTNDGPTAIVWLLLSVRPWRWRGVPGLLPKRSEPRERRNPSRVDGVLDEAAWRRSGLHRGVHPASAGRRRACLPTHRHSHPLRRTDGLFRDRQPRHGSRRHLPHGHPAGRRGVGGRRGGPRPRHVRRRQQRLRVHGELAGNPAGRALGGQRAHPGHHLGRQLAVGRSDERSGLDRRGRHPLRNGPLRAGNLHLGLQCDPLPPQESGAEPLDPGPFGVVSDRRDRQHHGPRSDRGRHQELRLHPLRAGGPPGDAGRHHGVRTRPALRAVQQHRHRLLLQPGFRHRRSRRRAGEPHPLRAVVPGEASLLSGRHGELPHPHRAVLLPPDRRHAVGREGQRQGRQVEGQRTRQPDGFGDRHL